MTIKQSFPPVIHDDAKILVLGSMPGEASLRQQQYYAHPQNLFWKILLSIGSEQLADFSYADKLSLLKQQKVALWDVLKHCERQGSLDSNIIAASEQANDLLTLLGDHPHIDKICFNGKKAFQSFQKHLLKPYPEFFQQYELIVLPSTSPANASISAAVKYQQWITEVWDRPRA